MTNFITNGASELPPVKTDLRSPTGATTEWAAEDANDLRQAAIDLRSAVIAESSSRVAADAAIIASGAMPANVGTAPVTATGTTQPGTVNDRFAREVWIEDFGEAGTGDWTGIFQAALAFLQSVNGGTLRLQSRKYRIDDQIVVPYTTPVTGFDQLGYQRGLRIVGSAFEGNSYMITQESSGTQLDMRYDAQGVDTGRFLATGNGTVVLEDLTFIDNGIAANSTPFLFATCATLHAHRVGFIGDRSGGYPDAIVLGGKGDIAATLSENSAKMWFAGYGTTIRACFFDFIGRALYGRIFSNNVVFDANCIWTRSNTTSPVVEFDNANLPPAPANSLIGNIITNNLIELVSRPYVVKLTSGCQGFFISGNTTYDPAAPWSTALYYLGSGSNNNYIATNSQGGIPILAGDATAIATTTLVMFDSQLTSQYPGNIDYLGNIVAKSDDTASTAFWKILDTASTRYAQFRLNPAVTPIFTVQVSADGVATDDALVLKRQGGAGYWEATIGGTTRSRLLSNGGYLQVLAPSGSSVDIGTELHPTDRFRADDTGIGFFGQAPTARPNITGAKGGNAALASLLTALNSMGLISDSTT